MESKQFGNKFILRIDKGEEVVETIKRFCKEQGIKLGHLFGLGATNKATIGLFETSTKKYHSKEFTGDFEIAPMYGNISTMKNEIYLHIHCNIAGKDYKAYAGHLNSAVVSGTCEVIIDKIDGEIDREFSEEIGLNLFSFAANS